ncbi:MAG: hypothetical protein IID45_10520 [Planctomycetes bacterium]|nr:hypothetical protein [Planctomycetota bacterium]
MSPSQLDASSTPIDRWLTAGVQADASDLHLVPGRPPLLRRHGRLQQIDEEPLDGDRRGPEGALRDLINVIRALREEVAQLRKEVKELRDRGPRPRFAPDRIRRPERPNIRRPDVRRPDDRKRDGVRKRKDGRKREDDRKRDGDSKRKDDRKPDVDRKRKDDRKPDSDRKRKGDRKPDGVR